MIEDEFDSDQKKKAGRGFNHSFYPLLFLPVIILSFLVGCQIQNSANLTKKPATSATDVQSVPTGEAATSAAVVPVPTPTTVSSNKLIIWLPPQFDPQSGTPVGALIQDRLARFVQANPGWVIEVRLKSLDGRGGLLDSLSNTSIAAPDALPVVVALQYKDMESASLKGLLLPLDNKVAIATQKNWLPYIQQLGKVQSTEYGLPFAGDALAMVYHPRQSPYPPTTWQELTTQNLPVFFPAADPGAVIITNLYQTAGGNLSPEENTPMLDADIMQKTFAFINNGTQSGAFPNWLSGYTTFDAIWQAYLEQKSGYALVWASQYLGDPIDNTTLVELPAVNSKKTTRANGWVWCIPEMNTQSQEIAVSLAEYLSDTDFVNQLDQQAGYLPVYTSGLDLIDDPNLKETISNLTSTAQIIPTGVTINTISPVFENATIQIIKKQLYYQQAVDQALSQVNK
jgi:multiple sugar transport system substrate-binding protein